MFLTVMIVLVETQRSIPDVCEFSPSNASRLARPMETEARPATLEHLSFAVGPVHSMTDNEAESQRSRAVQGQGGQEHDLEVILEVEESKVGTSG